MRHRDLSVFESAQHQFDGPLLNPDEPEFKLYADFAAQENDYTQVDAMDCTMATKNFSHGCAELLPASNALRAVFGKSNTSACTVAIF